MKSNTKTYVGFVADFPIEMKLNSPYGKELAKFVHSKLIENSWNIESPSNRQDWAWEWYWSKGNIKVITIVGCVDDMESNPPRQWLITNDFSASLLKKMFGGAKLKGELEDFARKYCETIHNAFINDPRFSHIVWYDALTFDKPGDKPGSKP